MDSRRSSFLIGSRTHTNVLEGKNIRKLDDGADNFADYWTDSGGEDISSTDSDNYTDLSKTQKEPNASEIRLKTLRQNEKSIRSSSILHSGTKVKDKQDHMKILTSPLKSVKHKVSKYDKSIHTSPTKTQKVSSKLKQDENQDSTISVNNVFNHFDQNSVDSESSLSSIILQHSVSVSKGSKKQTEISVPSPLPNIRNKVKSSQILSSTTLDNNKKENIELNASHHSPNSLRDSVEKEASPLLPKSKGKGKKSVSPKKGVVARNINEAIFPPSASDCNDISTGSLSPISKQSKGRRKTFVINESVSQANVDPSDIHMLSSVKFISTDSNLTSRTGLENNPLANKSSHESNSHIEHEEVSSISKSGSGNHTLMKLRNSSQISRTFAKYDEYDAKIMKMVHDNESSLKVLTTDHSLTLSSPKPTEENKAESNNSESDAEYEETNVAAQKEIDGKVKNQSYECVSNNKVLSRSQKKNSISRDRINTKLFQEKLVSDKENSELADIAHTSLHNHESQTEDVPLPKSVKNLTDSLQTSGRNVNAYPDKRKSSDIKSCLKRKSTSRTSPHKPILRSNSKNRQQSTLNSSNTLPKSTNKNDSETNDTRNDNVYLSHISDIQDNDLLRSLKLKSCIDKSKEKSKTDKSFSMGTIENAAENHEILKQPTSLYNKQEKIVNKIKKNLKASETFVKDNAESALDTSELENEISEDLHSNKRKHVSKTCKSALDTSELGNEILEDLHSNKRKHVSKTRKSALGTAELENEIPEDHSRKTKQVSETHISALGTSELENEIPEDLHSNKRKHISKTHKSVLDTSELENKILEDLHSKNTKHISKTHKSVLGTSESEIEISKSISRNNNVTNTSSKGNEMSQNFNNEKRKSVNKTHKKVKASKTFSVKNTEIATDIPVNENEILQNLNSKSKKHVNKIKKISEAVKDSLNENAKSAIDIPANEIRISQKFDKGRRKHSNNTHENLISFSTEGTENVVDVHSKESETMQNLHIKRKRPVSKIYEKLETSRTLSKNVENIDCELNNGGTPNFHSGKKNAKNKNKEKQKASETFIKDNQSTDNYLEAETETTSIHKKRKKHANKSHQNLSLEENNDQLVSPRKKKKRNEIHSTDENAALRRSARQKFPRLAVWRNERLLYRTENGITEVIGIDKGTGEDKTAINAILKKYLCKNENKEKVKNVRKKCNIQDVINNKKVSISLVKHFDAIPWDKGYQDKECPYRIKRLFESKNSASGFIQIEVNEEKPMQYMPNEDICLTVIRGKIEVTIHENVDVVKEKSMFLVPRCVPYSLKNVGSTRALITFCVGKFEYLESHS